jgi:hypothetical protein
MVHSALPHFAQLRHIMWLHHPFVTRPPLRLLLGWLLRRHTVWTLLRNSGYSPARHEKRKCGKD